MFAQGFKENKEKLGVSKSDTNWLAVGREKKRREHQKEKPTCPSICSTIFYIFRCWCSRESISLPEFFFRGLKQTTMCGVSLKNQTGETGWKGAPKEESTKKKNTNHHVSGGCFVLKKIPAEKLMADARVPRPGELRARGPGACRRLPALPAATAAGGGGAATSAWDLRPDATQSGEGFHWRNPRSSSPLSHPFFLGERFSC